MFEKVQEASFIHGEHEMLRYWDEQGVFQKLREKNAGKKKWSFLDGPITANNPMGVHHAWGRTYKDTYQRYFAMTGHELRYQNGFDCQGLWVEVEVEKEMNLGTKNDVAEFGIDKFVNECKKRVLKFAARQTEQSQRLGYWMDWDTPDELRKLAQHVGTDDEVEYTPASGEPETGKAHNLVERLGNPAWGGSYFTFATENNETIWTFLKKCFDRKKIYRGHDVMPWSGRGGSAYSQMEVADGRKLTVHRSIFVRFPLIDRENEFLLIWTTTPWTLTSNVAAAVNPDLDYVKLKSNRDDAVYYFAKDNLDFQRLSREYKEGFGRPEWSWPDDVPKLKTLSQIFKEQGGYEELDTIKGATLVGWRYQGPFDELPAQQQPGGLPEEEDKLDKTGVTCHQVVDGGRDSRGSAHVVAGEGTGIVHIAPGCGDVDHTLGKELGLVGIAPLGEDGRFVDGFGEFTGKVAIDPATADFVFEQLKEKQLLVNVEQYPHIYPHCWRTGDELVFRLVDEWFINMDWREEIKDVTREIDWLPKSVDGEERELEWLTNMRDWMISKKRFWGLALPIWVNPEDPTDFEVMGSLAELKERAVEGWDEFEGHTPHRPWIDKVKIKSETTGVVLSRIEDVGNPWLDAGIVPFSTMMYNSNPEAWQEWYPADFVTECFPGQFRNWFYAMLSMSTMMRYDETDDAAEKKPFKTLLGHRLVMNEEGQPMHKSDGTAIWFEEAAEQLGVDTIRWMYLAQNPASDLRFGTRHGEDHVELNTPEGTFSETKEGVATCKVTSGPADEIRRQILIPLWNSYAFFVNYARLDDFDPNAPQVPLEERVNGDPWILSNLQELIETAHREMQAFNVAGFCEATALFIDDLSNWYIRRNRRRFWRSKDASDTDKLAAYQTLYEVLTTLSKLLAPCIPFLSERIYQNLVRGVDDSAPESVHLCDYPEHDEGKINRDLGKAVAVGQRVVRLGHKLREEQNLRVRQPLAELQFTCGSPEEVEYVLHLQEAIADELNVKSIKAAEHLDNLVSYSYKPNLKTLGPKYGKLLGVIRQQLPEVDASLLDPLRKGESVTIELDGNTWELGPDDVLVSTEQATDWASADDAGIQIALSMKLTPELEREGIARDFVRQVQQLRKDHDLEIENRIIISYQTENETILAALKEWNDYISGETLADHIASGSTDSDVKEVQIGEEKVAIWIEKVS
ncbi:MAG: class I tRNA ligase family protein [Planctomycetaceae bacterium]|jgi:isoleucyl-tRNA synthetase|nr:class I tRNA ligase family protein [Planctomycetaceae bacterium]